MKSFSEFETYMHNDGKSVHDEIVNEVNSLVKKANIENKFEEHEFYRRAWVEVGFMKMLKLYHEWLNS